MATGPNDAHSDIRWDAFLSYSSRDAAKVKRIQRFLENYRLPDRKRLRVYRDETDIAGGELPTQLRSALAASGCLLVCCSEHAAQSDWVAREIDAYRELAAGRPVLPILLSGDPPANLPASLRGHEIRWADLRPGWHLARPRAKTRIELVRVVATAAGANFRELLPLDRQRRRRQFVLAGSAVGVAIAAAAFYPVVAWQDVTPDGQPVFGCGALDDGIAFYQRNEPQATKQIVKVTRNAFGQKPVIVALDNQIIPTDRLLPGMLGVGNEGCGHSGSWAGTPEPGLCIVVEESDERGGDDPMGGADAALTDVKVGRHLTTLSPLWTPVNRAFRDEYGRTLHPSDGLPVSVRRDEIWLGMPADEFNRGGLWYSADAGRDWQKRLDFTDVRSVHHLGIGTLVAARRSGELGFYLLREGEFVPFDVPGKGDSLEVCGEVDGHPVLRADRRIYQRTAVARWRTLLR